MQTRLNKYLAERGFCSRRQADALIASGKVKVNGAVATLGLKVDDRDDIVVLGQEIEKKRPQLIYLVFHKPVGIITSVDAFAKDSVRSFLRLQNHLFPVGRLDVASSGLLILTNDGALSEKITHPRYHHEKEYLVSVDKPVRREDLRVMAEGMMILGTLTKKAQVKKNADQRFQIILTEGRNRQIRRMCEQLGYEVKALKRTRVMNIELGDLPSGHTRPLTQKELRELKRTLE
ncbi:MAG: Pseudouridine synthase [Candidatus Uhrbacteria bacterium GW2011_GWF2_39_13]|uniref:Pseudouridine synthase n=1 Tax=Candidatus Uhrbacteria bacterium GW2011_GWF2_39_13 TaxID=1618995 RepID=A0A0G0ML09_9BACT|nr:MAG: Pseudouridine synthase [Candidatus Uhrbacteria bacterium GW2011_GWF2_39_13]HAU65930.1 23S rRNA pseudouridine synthase F [Candidatus Uhrbacteria bacterium]